MEVLTKALVQPKRLKKPKKAAQDSGPAESPGSMCCSDQEFGISSCNQVQSSTVKRLVPALSSNGGYTCGQWPVAMAMQHQPGLAAVSPVQARHWLGEQMSQGLAAISSRQPLVVVPMAQSPAAQAQSPAAYQQMMAAQTMSPTAQMQSPAAQMQLTATQ